MDKKWKGEKVLIPVPFEVPAAGITATESITIEKALPPGFVITNVYADVRTAVVIAGGTLTVGPGQDPDGYFTDLASGDDTGVQGDGDLASVNKTAANNENGELDVVLSAVTEDATAGEGVIYFEGVQG